MYKFQFTLKDVASDFPIGKGYLNLHLGSYQLEVTEGILKGTIAEGKCQTRTDFGLLTHHLEEFASTQLVMPGSVLNEVREHVYGELSFISKENNARVLIQGRLIYCEANGWKVTDHGSEVAA
ncbi:MAG TPA: hypothetical protein DCE41_29695 [Cytophagales bacterium]|nr:hypothetical protein [Cytophagales bacterium]HAA23855.1 hypothetical protein [Cytophagales bacterium]HAP59932.1 hypothetical protein [Cytophagales bacterium]